MREKDNTQILRLQSLQEQLLDNINLKKLDGLLEAIDVIKSNSLKDLFPVVGEFAKNFTIKDQEQNISLNDLCNKNNILLVFIRGGWCPYCYLQLRDLQGHLNEFKKLNTEIVAISAEKQNYCLSTAKRHGLTYKIFSDKANNIAKKYKLIYEAEHSINLFADLGLQQAITNGELSYQMPVPATFFIDQQKIIRYVHANPDYKQRPKVDMILDAIRNLS